MPVAENVATLVAWLDSFERRQPKEDFEFTDSTAAAFKAAMVTSNEW